MRSRLRATLSMAAHLGKRRRSPSKEQKVNAGSEPLVARCWSDAATRQSQFEMLGWLDSPIVRNEYVLPQLFPKRSSDYWVREVVERYSIPRNGLWLSLGCGTGKHELLCRQQELCASVDAYDIAPEAIRIARARAIAAGLQGINFRVADFEHMDFPVEHYDVVFAAMALHHIYDVEGVVQRIARCLKPGGWLIADEYIGPARFQFPDRQLLIVNQLLSLLPERYTYDYVHNQSKEPYERRPVEFWLEVDPSEAACSDQIEATLLQYLERVNTLPYGGPILGPLLEHIVGNFDPGSEEDVAIVRLLGCIEKILIEQGLLNHDFAILLGQKL